MRLIIYREMYLVTGTPACVRVHGMLTRARRCEVSYSQRCVYLPPYSLQKAERERVSEWVRERVRDQKVTEDPPGRWASDTTSAHKT